MKQEDEQKLIEILVNSSLNVLKFKDALEYLKIETVKKVKSEVDNMSEEEKTNLLKNLEKQIAAAEELAREQQEQAVAKAKQAEEVK
jgi:hypothetical protein